MPPTVVSGQGTDPSGGGWGLPPIPARRSLHWGRPVRGGRVGRILRPPRAPGSSGGDGYIAARMDHGLRDELGIAAPRAWYGVLADRRFPHRAGPDRAQCRDTPHIRFEYSTLSCRIAETAECPGVRDHRSTSRPCPPTCGGVEARPGDENSSETRRMSWRAAVLDPSAQHLRGIGRWPLPRRRSRRRVGYGRRLHPEWASG